MGKRKLVNIVVKQDESCEMAELWLDGELVFNGNEWDFGSGVDNHVDTVGSVLRKLGIDYKIYREEYNADG